MAAGGEGEAGDEGGQRGSQEAKFTQHAVKCEHILEDIVYLLLTVGEQRGRQEANFTHHSTV